MSTAAALVREAIASGRSQAMASALTIAVVGGMCLAALLTSGRTVAAEEAVLAQIDAAGTRSIIVRADPRSGVTAELLDRLEGVEGVESSAGFGPIVDARNAAISGGTQVPLRNGFGSIGDRNLIVGGQTSAGDVVLASDSAARALGLYHGIGAVITNEGQSFTVVEDLTAPEHFAFLEPLLIVPSSTAQAPSGGRSDDPLTVVVVVAKSPQEVAAVTTLVRTLLNPTEPNQVTLETSEELAAIRAAVSGELGTYGRRTVLGIIAVSGLLVTINLLALVTMRRKDFGRRRALGARQSLIVSLLLVQVAILGLVGAVLGVTAALVTLTVIRAPLPDLAFTGAVAISAILTAVIAAVVPAIVAARRDPLYELRVP